MSTNGPTAEHEKVRTRRAAILAKVGSLEFERLYEAVRHKHDQQYSRANGHRVLAAWNKAKRGLPLMLISPATNRALLRRRRIYRSKYSIDVALQKLSPATVAGIRHRTERSGASIDDIVDRVGMQGNSQIFDFTLEAICDMQALRAPAPVTVCIARLIKDDLVYGAECTKTTLVGADFSLPMRFGLTKQEIDDSDRIFLFIQAELQMPKTSQQRMSRRGGLKRDEAVEYAPKLAFGCHELARRSSRGELSYCCYTTQRVFFKFEYTEDDLDKLDTLDDLHLNNKDHNGTWDTNMVVKIRRLRPKKEPRARRSGVVAAPPRDVRVEYFCVAGARELALAETSAGFVSPLGRPRTFASATQLLQYLRARTELCFTVREQTERSLRVEVWLSARRTDKLGYHRPRMIKLVNKNFSKILTFNTAYAPACLLNRRLTVVREDELARQTRRRLDVDWLEAEISDALPNEKDFYLELNAYIQKYCMELCRKDLFLTLLLFRDRFITQIESPELQTLYFQLLALKASFFMECQVLTPDQEYAVVTGDTSNFDDIDLNAFEKRNVISKERAASLPPFHDKRTKPHDGATLYKRFEQMPLKKRGKRARCLLIPRKPGDYLPPRRFGTDRKTIVEGILQPDGTVLPTQQPSTDPKTPPASPPSSQ